MLLPIVCTFFYYNRMIVFLFVFRFAYIEFADKESVRTAMALDESLFRGRQIKVRFFIFIFLQCSWAFTFIKLWLTVKSVDCCIMWEEIRNGQHNYRVFLTRSKKPLLETVASLFWIIKFRIIDKMNWMEPNNPSDYDNNALGE